MVVRLIGGDAIKPGLKTATAGTGIESIQMLKRTGPGLLMEFFGQLVASDQPLKLPHQRSTMPCGQFLAGAFITAAQAPHEGFVTDRSGNVGRH